MTVVGLGIWVQRDFRECGDPQETLAIPAQMGQLVRRDRKGRKASRECRGMLGRTVNLDPWGGEDPKENLEGKRCVSINLDVDHVTCCQLWRLI